MCVCVCEDQLSACGIDESDPRRRGHYNFGWKNRGVKEECTCGSEIGGCLLMFLYI